MCGIAGYFLNSEHLHIEADFGDYLRKKMLDNIAHRGPDSRGEWSNKSSAICLCHTRLSIVDLSDEASQPMSNADNSCILTFNGEIYNWMQLREELISIGYYFRTKSDTEVLLIGYRHWGVDVLSRLRGMFAFTIWDDRTKALFCARDRVGKKPFVFAETPAGFVFGSEIPVLLDVAQPLKIDTSIDGSAVAAMLLHNLRHIPDPATAYKGIRRLRAGHAMIVRNGKVAEQWRYWTLREDIADAGERISPADVRRSLEEAINLRRMADVPIGAFLSGGVDSTAIVALTQKLSGRSIRTYALGLDENDEDLRRARAMAAHLGTTHREFYFDSDRQWAGFELLQRTHGEPIMLLPLIHTLELCKAVRSDGIKVVLGGHGADEIFYGYTGMIQTALLSKGVSLFGWLAPLLSVIPENRSRSLQVLSASPGHRKAALYALYAKETWPSLICEDARSGLRNYAAEELAYWGEVGPNRDYIDESNFGGLMVENTHSVTTASDLPAMVAGVEMRAPFLDHQLLAVALATPWQQKIGDLRDTGRLKLILKQAVADLMPADILFAPKRGFGMGVSQDDVILKDWAVHGDELFSQPDDCDGLFDPVAVRSLWTWHRENGSSGSNLVSNMFAIQYWLQNVRTTS